MARRQPAKEKAPKRGLLARPLDTLVFILPLILFYEISSLTRSQDRVIAFDLLRHFFELFGHVGVWAPGVGVIAILLATQMVSGEKWKISWRRAGWMYVEAAVLAIPLLAINWWILLSAGNIFPAELLDRIAMGVGAGIYEELVFRLALMCIIMIVGVDILHISRSNMAFVAIVLSAMAFSAHHYQPVGVEPFELTSFCFRSIAGVYLAVVFWYRGYGPAAGCHAAYNVVLACMSTNSV